MQLLRLILCLLALGAASSVQASAVVVTVNNGASGWWVAALLLLGLEHRRPVPEPSTQHLSAQPPQARDSCTFVAGVRHCPLAKPRAEPR
jgi:hypothetical protein